MTTRILLAKYVPDRRRWEPRNIGVIVVTESANVARFVGERGPDDVDRRQLRFVGDTEAYTEWVAHWRRCMVDGEEALREAVAEKSAPYLLLEAAEIVASQFPMTADQILEQYYDQLVDEPAAQSESRLKVLSEALLQRAQVRELPYFREPFEIKSKTLDPPQPNAFHYGWANGRVVVAHRVTLLADNNVNNVLWRFEHLGNEVDKIALVYSDPLAPDREIERRLRVYVAGQARLIDVDSEIAPDQVREALRL